MNARGLSRYPWFTLLTACAVFALLLSACQPAAVATNPPPSPLPATELPTEPPAAPTEPPAATELPAPVTEPPVEASGGITLDLSGVAQSQTLETVEAVAPGADRPWWEALPEHRIVTLQGYPVAEHLHQPQIFIYPAAELAQFNEASGQMLTDLQALLQSGQLAENLPFLPPINAGQMMHAQVQNLDFQNGRGVRFLTQLAQGVVPINSYELMYTFQGLTNDGQYYVAAVLPVSHPDLPATNQVSPEQAAELEDFPAYLTETVDWLEQQPGSSFTPDLGALDAMIQSLEVK